MKINSPIDCPSPVYDSYFRSLLRMFLNYEKLNHFLRLHYIVNVLLCIVFYFLKVFEPFCSSLFDDCHLELVSGFNSESWADIVSKQLLFFRENGN